MTVQENSLSHQIETMYRPALGVFISGSGRNCFEMNVVQDVRSELCPKTSGVHAATFFQCFSCFGIGTSCQLCAFGELLNHHTYQNTPFKSMSIQHELETIGKRVCRQRKQALRFLRRRDWWFWEWYHLKVQPWCQLCIVNMISYNNNDQNHNS